LIVEPVAQGRRTRYIDQLQDMCARGRFAPSPTGPLHFGSLVAALASFLEARTRGGNWLIRIEDIDTPRVVPGAADDILRTLDAFGMTWDGPVVYQSRRIERYREALARLSDLGLTYPCSCSRREIARTAAPGTAVMTYPGTCRRGARHPERPTAIRLRTDDRTIGFDDGIQGLFEQHLETQVGDFVIRRADGLFAYQLAVVVDDADQGITHIVRGSDLLDSTPRQIHLQRLLGLPTPRYSHLPLAVDQRGNKLSKQTQAPPLDHSRLGHAIVAALSFLNQSPPPHLARESLATIRSWALKHWRPCRIPARTSLDAPPPAAKTAQVEKPVRQTHLTELL
jgi:glutamyl-Q tRNA(Asp) synthetase